MTQQTREKRETKRILVPRQLLYRSASLANTNSEDISIYLKTRVLMISEFREIVDNEEGQKERLELFSRVGIEDVAT
jgi:hypothetical protein